MVDFNKELVSALNAVLPTYYEMTLKSGTATPCLSYMELNNYCVTDVNGASLGYSKIMYQIKVWAHSLADIQKYSLLVDKALVPLGFKRISSGELFDNESTMIQKILTYECLALEEYN